MAIFPEKIGKNKKYFFLQEVNQRSPSARAMDSRGTRVESDQLRELHSIRRSPSRDPVVSDTRVVATDLRRRVVTRHDVRAAQSAHHATALALIEHGRQIPHTLTRRALGIDACDERGDQRTR